MPLTEAGFTRLKKLVRKATKAGAVGIDTVEDLALDGEVLRDVLVLVRSGGASAARTACDLVRRILESENAKIRYRGLLLADELFLRSRAFRSQLCGDIRGFSRSVMRIPGLSELPPPEKAQVLLHRTALLKVLPNWRKHFAREQPSLRLAMQFVDGKLGSVGRVLGGRHEQEARRRRDRSRRLRLAQFETVCDEMSEQSGSQRIIAIRAARNELEATLELLDARFEALSAQHRAAHSSAEAAPPSASPSPPQPLSSSSSSTTTRKLPAKAAAAAAAEARQKEAQVAAKGEESSDDDSEDDFFDVDWSGVEPAALAPGAADARAGAASPEVDDDMEEWASFHHDAREREAHRARENKLVEHLAPDFRLEINVRPPPQKPDVIAEQDLGVVVSSFRDACREAIRQHIPQLERWIEVLTRAELDESASRLRRGDLLNLALSLKRAFVSARERGEAYGIHVSADNAGAVEETDFFKLLEKGAVGDYVDARSKLAREEAKARRKEARPASSSQPPRAEAGSAPAPPAKRRASRDPFARPRKRK